MQFLTEGPTRDYPTRLSNNVVDILLHNAISSVHCSFTFNSTALGFTMESKLLSLCSKHMVE